MWISVRVSLSALALFCLGGIAKPHIIIIIIIMVRFNFILREKR